MKLRELYQGFVSLLTSSEFRNQISDPNGTGEVVFNNSPTFVGTVNSPTPTPGNNTTQVATTAFVQDIIIDEDDMVSNLDTKVPSQQSVKAYVDTNAGGGWQLLNSVDLTNGGANDLSSVSFAIPSGTKHTKCVLHNMATSAISSHLFRIGTGSVVKTTGYVGGTGVFNDAFHQHDPLSSGFSVITTQLGPPNLFSGMISIVQGDGNTYIAAGDFYSAAIPYTAFTQGDVTLTGAIDILAFVNTQSTWTSGTLEVYYQ